MRRVETNSQSVTVRLENQPCGEDGVSRALLDPEAGMEERAQRMEERRLEAEA